MRVAVCFLMMFQQEAQPSQGGDRGAEGHRAHGAHPGRDDHCSQAAEGRADQVNSIDFTAGGAVFPQEYADDHPGEKERGCQGSVMQQQDQDLDGVDEHAEGIKRQPVGEQVGTQHAKAGGKGQPMQNVTASVAGFFPNKRQDGAAGAHAEQGDADGHKCEMVELGDGEQAGQVDLEG